MANDFKHWKRRSVALCSLALVASLSVGVFAACTPADDTTDDEEEEETVSQTDTQTIRNGNFEFYTESDVEDLDEKRVLINTPTNWSFTSGSPHPIRLRASSTLPSGTISRRPAGSSPP